MRPRLDRRQALKLLGASAVATSSPLFAGLHPLVPPPDDGGEWRPRFLTSEEVHAVAELAERILPATDTPGAKGAKVHQYIDWRLSEDPEEEADAFRQGMRRLGDRALAAYRRPLLELEPQQLDALLSRIADGGRVPDPDHAFFRSLKAHTVEGYYRSEIGMIDELGFAGNDYLDAFQGCEHREHLDWRPAGAGSDDEDEA